MIQRQTTIPKQMTEARHRQQATDHPGPQTARSPRTADKTPPSGSAKVLELGQQQSERQPLKSRVHRYAREEAPVVTAESVTLQLLRNAAKTAVTAPLRRRAGVEGGRTPEQCQEYLPGGGPLCWRNSAVLDNVFSSSDAGCAGHESPVRLPDPATVQDQVMLAQLGRP